MFIVLALIRGSVNVSLGVNLLVGTGVNHEVGPGVGCRVSRGVDREVSCWFGEVSRIAQSSEILKWG